MILPPPGFMQPTESDDERYEREQAEQRERFWAEYHRVLAKSQQNASQAQGRAR